MTYAGLGGDNFFLKSGVDSSWFFPATEETTLAFRGRYGQATGMFNKPLPLYERFYVGGIYTVRGIGYGEGGPRDANGDVIGGTKQAIFNAEYIFPLVSELKFKGVTFLMPAGHLILLRTLGILNTGQESGSDGFLL